MKLHLLSYSSPKKNQDWHTVAIQMLIDAAQKRGHTLELVYAKDCQLAFLKKPFILINNKRPSNIRALIVRPSFHGHDLEMHIGLIKQFELSGIRVINNHLSVMRAKNKLRQLQIFNKHHIATPQSYVVRSSSYIEQMAKKIGSFPLIIKTLGGSLGVGVSIVESQRALRSLVEMIVNDDDAPPLIVQEYVKEAKGRDIRVFVVGGKIVAAMERIARKKGEFRSNFSLGGKVRITELTKKEQYLALKAARVCDLEIAGVDIIRTKQGPKILEINSNPGLEGITEATGIDVAGAIIEYAVRVASKTTPGKSVISKKLKDKP